MSSGRLQDIGVADLLRGLRTISGTGRLRVQSASEQQSGDVRIVYLDKGSPVYAISNVVSERLGEVLIAAGKIDKKALLEALQQTSVKRKLGEVLIELGYLQPEDLAWGIKQQVKQIVSALFTLEEGSFAFEACEIGADIVPLDLEPNELLRESVGSMTSPRLFLQSLGTMEGVLELNGHAEAARQVAEDKPKRYLLALLKSKRMSVRELCRRSSLTAIETCRFLTLLVTLGYVTKVLPD